MSNTSNAIANFILKQIGINRIWDYILTNSVYQEGFTMASQSLQDAFTRVPDLSASLKSRKIALLKSVMIEEKTNERIKGHIEELEYILRFDVPSKQTGLKVKSEPIKVPDKRGFLGAWNKDNEDNENNENKKQKAGEVSSKQSVPAEGITKK